MAVALLAVSFDTAAPQSTAHFWATLLQRQVVAAPDGVAEPDGWLLPGTASQVGLLFRARRGDVGVDGRSLHLHVTSNVSPQAEVVDRALALGGAHHDVGQLPDEGHVVLIDPDGNEFCVIEAGNSYLAGTGLLGEVACDGTRTVGLFWSAVLGWPLVWDQDEETAIQSPSGGTKLAWGGPPLEPQHGRNPQHFVLTVPLDSAAAEAARLADLGAHRVDPAERAGGTEGAMEFTDPDGNEFTLRVG